jgi:hypothetical protein
METPSGTRSGRVEFRCAGQVFSHYAEDRLLGAFDGTDRRELRLHVLADKSTQVLVSLHENLHHDLQWSTGWGVLAAFCGMLAEANVNADRMRAVATFANEACRRVHEVFATTTSTGALGVDEGRQLLAGNDVYLDYLGEGLRLGGATYWPWQFRESATQVLLRTLMQPAIIAEIAEKGLEHVTVAQLARSNTRPDEWLALITDQAGRWWQDTFEELSTDYPDRGGDLGDAQGRRLPRGDGEFDRLRTWEETILITRLRELAVRRLRGHGLPVLDDGEYLQVTERLVNTFDALAPENWTVRVLNGPAGAAVEPLGAERESILLHGTQATAAIRRQEDLVEDSREFLFTPAGSPGHIIGLYLHRSVLHRQFNGLADLSADGPAVVALAGRPQRVVDIDRLVPLVLLRPGLLPRDLGTMFTTLPVIMLTTLTTTRVRANQPHIAGLNSTYVLVDLPLRRQFDAWITAGWTVRFRAIELHGGRPVNCAVFGLDQLPGIRFLSYRSEAGWTELVGLLDRHRDILGPALEVDERTRTEIGSITSWLMAAWWRFEEVDHW